ncbi:hypothetical protein B484DRAFT_355557, partial [Ochromonadaceae sp. CCMP2298]
MFAGLFNGSWQLPLKEKCPSAIRIVSDTGWQFENVWLVYSFVSCIFAIILAFGLLGAGTLNATYAAVPVGEVLLVSMFALLWGVGSFGFGQAVQILGMAIGTSLCMGVVLVLGTLLPLLYDHIDEAGTPAFIWTIVGVLFGIVGFTLTSTSATASASLSVSTSATASASLSVSTSATASASLSVSTSASPDTGRPPHSAATGLVVAIFGGVLASQLQFSFVFGQPLIDEAQSQGASEFASTQVSPQLLLCY